MTKAEFERRAAEMKERQQNARKFRDIPPPRSIFAPPLPTRGPAKVSLRDFLRDADLSTLNPALKSIGKIGQLETDRDGLLNFSASGFHIEVSPELLLEALQVYDSVLKAAAETGWSLETSEGAALRIAILNEPLELAVTERTEPVAEIRVRPGERRPRKPSGALQISFSAGWRTVKAFARQGGQVEAKIPDLLLKAKALAAEVRAENEKREAERRDRELESKRRHEIERRIARLDRDVTAWHRAEQMRAYAAALEENLCKRGAIDLGSDASKWLKWVRIHADNLDPTQKAFKIASQDFWEWDLKSGAD